MRVVSGRGDYTSLWIGPRRWTSRAARRRNTIAMTKIRLTTSAHPDLSEIDLAMMRRAMELARQAAGLDEVPVGAVVYRGDRIIAEGINLRESTSDPVSHAELLAMSKAGRKLNDWRLSDCSLAVTLEPCPMCAGAMVNARLGRVIYGAPDPKAGACHTLYKIPNDIRLNHEVRVIGGLMADECGNILREFFRRKREAKKNARKTA